MLSKENIIKNLALFISKYREVHGYSMEKLAKLSDLSLGYISQLENGTIKSIPKISTLDSLSKAFGMPVYKLQYLAGYLSEKEFNALSEIKSGEKVDIKEDWQTKLKSILSDLGFKRKYTDEIIQYIQTVRLKQEFDEGNLGENLPELKSFFEL